MKIIHHLQGGHTPLHSEPDHTTNSVTSFLTENSSSQKIILYYIIKKDKKKPESKSYQSRHDTIVKVYKIEFKYNILERKSSYEKQVFVRFGRSFQLRESANLTIEKQGE